MNNLLIDEDKIYSVTESYEFYKNYVRARENLDEIDWDIISVQLDHANIDFIREFKDFIRWDLIDSDTYCKWKHNKDPRYFEFRKELENTEVTNKTLDDEWFVNEFIKKLMK